MTNYSHWLTKQQAAEAIGCSTKTVEQLAKQQRLHKQYWKRPETGAKVSMYHPDDVAVLRKERNPAAEPFVVPERSENSQKPATTALALAQQTPQQLMQVFAGMLAAASQNSETPPEVRLPDRLYLTVREAAAFAGLGEGYLRRLIKDGRLALLRHAGRKGADVIRRADLEKL